jgi:hypothetical protein
LNERAGGRSPAAKPAPKRLKYEAVRDHFLTEAPQTDEEALDFFVHLGMYIYGRWQSISADAERGETVDEDSSKRWDDCTDSEFEEIRERAEGLIDREVARRRVTTFIASLLKKPWDKIAAALGWTVMTAVEGFVGAIGILLFGLVVVWVAPHITKSIRSAMDDVLPKETRPNVGQNGSAGQNAQ